jgi:hypothetical protein
MARMMAIGHNTPRDLRERMSDEIMAWGQGRDQDVRRFAAVAHATGIKTPDLEALLKFDTLDDAGRALRAELADRMVTRVQNSSLLEINAFVARAGLN